MKNLWCVLTLAAIPCLAAPANAEVISRNAADLLGSESVEVNYNPAVNASDEELVVAQGAKTKAIPSQSSRRNGWYVSGGVDVLFQDDSDVPRFESDLQPSVAVGYKFSNGLRLESHGGAAALFNVYYDFSRETKARPYVSAGVGLAKIEYRLGPFQDDEYKTAWQIKGGISYQVSPRGDIYGELKYLNVDIEPDSYNTIGVGFGYTYNF